MVSRREEFIDVAKGLLIIAVVMGHSTIDTNVKSIIYWFHMPAFFIVSGILFKTPKERMLNFRGWVKNLALRYFIPYFSFYALISVFTRGFFKDILSFLYGGRMYPFVFWYIPVLFFTIILFGYLVDKFNTKKVLIIIGLMYVVGHLESIYYLPNNTDYQSWKMIYKIPLNLDVCLVSTAYFGIGYYLKANLNKLVSQTNIKNFSVLTLLCTLLIILHANGIFKLNIDMKIGNYKNVILDSIIPLMYIVWILMLSKIITLSKFISFPFRYIGENTLSIMYLHIYTFSTVLFVTSNTYALILLGVICPLIFSFICKRNYISAFLFLGIQRAKKLNEIETKSA